MRPRLVVAVALSALATATFGTDVATSTASTASPPPAATAITSGGLNWQAKPTVIDPPSGGLTSISCVSPTWCRATNSRAQVLNYDGKAWRVGRSFVAPQELTYGRADLGHMVCTSTTFCVAGISTFALEDNLGWATFDGSHWKVWNLNAPPPTMGDVSCVDRNFCLAILGNDQFSIFNGHGWSKRSRVADLQGTRAVSCASTTRCLAVDNDGNSSLYNGSGWASKISADPGHALVDVDCPDQVYCEAVDNAGRTVRFQYTFWSAPRTADTSGGIPSQISCSSKDFCAVVDTSGYSSVYQGGKDRWTSPTLVQKEGELRGVSCPTSTFCTAAATQGSAIRRLSGAWETPKYVARAIGGPTDVSCAAKNLCVLVDKRGGATIFDGKAWQPPHRAIAGPEGLTQVSCPTTSFCMALTDDGRSVIRRDGLWSTTPLPVDGIENTGVLSCSSANFCLAMGTYHHGSRWDGTRWTSVRTPYRYYTGDVSCVSSTFCLSIDNYVDVRRWDGSDFGTRISFHGGGDQMFSLSCATTTFCMGFTGQDDTYGEANTPLLFDGTDWSAATATDNVPGEHSSCASTSLCVSVESGGNIASWNGTTWGDTDRFAGPPSPLFLLLNSVSCVPNVCAAVSADGSAFAAV